LALQESLFLAGLRIAAPGSVRIRIGTNVRNADAPRVDLAALAAAALTAGPGALTEAPKGETAAVAASVDVARTWALAAASLAWAEERKGEAAAAVAVAASVAAAEVLAAAAGSPAWVGVPKDEVPAASAAAAARTLAAAGVLWAVVAPT
jgi:hypothetical protein